MTRYVGTGVGLWRGPWYVYAPSAEDRALARELGDEVAHRLNARPRSRSGYGPRTESRAVWHSVGILGEIAALHPLETGPDLRSWRGERGWYGAPDYLDLEIRTSSSYQLGLVGRPPAGRILGGWMVSTKDRGRRIVCVENRDSELLVRGYVPERDVPRLPEPIGGIVAVVDYTELLPYDELVSFLLGVVR